jgi:hypothetical protein
MDKSIFKKAKVILVPDTKRENCVGLIRCTKYWESSITPDTDWNDVNDLAFGKNTSDGVFEFWQPMTMNIVVDNKIVATTSTDNHLPEPSKGFIEKFIREHNKGSNKMYEVLVEYDDYGYQKLMNPEEPLPTKHHHYWIENILLKVNPNDNTITIHKCKDSWTKEEVIELCGEAYALGVDKNPCFSQWLTKKI